MAPKYKACLIAFVVSLGLDQGSKIWARDALKAIYPESKTVIAGFWEFRYSENTGSAFGLFRSVPGARYLLFGIGILALGVVWSYLKKAAPHAWRLGAELGLLAGGALGNIIDRVAFGKVTDFVVWRAGNFEWPTFNVADAALVVGVLGLLVDWRPPNIPAPGAKSAAKKRA